MFSTLTVVAAGGAAVAFAASLIAIAHRLLTVEKGAAPAAPDSGQVGRPSARPLLASLYREPEPSPWTRLSTLPGGLWVGLATILALGALGSAALGATAAPVVPTAPDSAVTGLQARVDSLAGLVTQLHDSLRLVRRPAPATQPRASADRLVRRSAAAASTVLPPPEMPTLPPTQ